jgi:hypothetical protein
MSTGWASDWAVHRPDWLGCGTFSGVPSVCKGWNAVRVPPRAQCFRRSGADWVTTYDLFGLDDTDGHFRWCAEQLCRNTLFSGQAS